MNCHQYVLRTSVNDMACKVVVVCAVLTAVISGSGARLIVQEPELRSAVTTVTPAPLVVSTVTPLTPVEVHHRHQPQRLFIAPATQVTPVDDRQPAVQSYPRLVFTSSDEDRQPQQVVTAPAQPPPRLVLTRVTPVEQQPVNIQPAQRLLIGSVASRERDDEYDPNPQYTFTYTVEDGVTGDSKAHHETRQGDVIQGAYTLLDPDGSRRTVQYTADNSGFNAYIQRQVQTHSSVQRPRPVQPSTPVVVTTAAPLPRVSLSLPSEPATFPQGLVPVRRPSQVLRPLTVPQGPLYTRVVLAPQQVVASRPTTLVQSSIPTQLAFPSPSFSPNFGPFAAGPGYIQIAPPVYPQSFQLGRVHPQVSPFLIQVPSALASEVSSGEVDFSSTQQTPSSQNPDDFEPEEVTPATAPEEISPPRAPATPAPVPTSSAQNVPASVEPATSPVQFSPAPFAQFAPAQAQFASAPLQFSQAPIQVASALAQVASALAQVAPVLFQVSPSAASDTAQFAPSVQTFPVISAEKPVTTTPPATTPLARPALPVAQPPTATHSPFNTHDLHEARHVRQFTRGPVYPLYRSSVYNYVPK